MSTEQAITITDLRQLTATQLAAVLAKAEVHATGIVTHPPLDLPAIRSRAEELDPRGQTKADIYSLLIEIDRLNDCLSPKG